MILLTDEEIERVVSKYIVRTDYSASVGDRAIAKAQAKKILDGFECDFGFNDGTAEDSIKIIIYLGDWQQLRKEIDDN